MEINRTSRQYMLIMAVVVIGILALELINGRFYSSDLLVYWSAVHEWLNGGLPYAQAFGENTGFFKYSPFALFLFSPMAILPFKVAAVIHYLITAMTFILSVLLITELISQRMTRDPLQPTLKMLLLITLVCMVHLHRELHLGNVNVILLLLLVLALRALTSDRMLTSGILIGTVILIKPHFIVLIPLLFLHRKWVSLLTSFAFIFIGLVLPALVTGWQPHVAFTKQWMHAMAEHNHSMIYTGGDFLPQINTIYSISYAYFFKWIGIAPIDRLVLAILALVALAFLLLVFRQRNTERPEVAIIFQAMVLISIVPNLTVTDTEHFLFSVPLIALLLMTVVTRPFPIWWYILLIIALLMYGGNLEDALGSFSTWMARNGILGAGNLLLIAVAVRMMLQGRLRTAR